MNECSNSENSLSPLNWGASITCIYIPSKSMSYTIDMCKLPTTKHYVFYNHFLGEVIIDHLSEEIISTTQPISEKYTKFIHLTLKTWKEHFKEI